MRPNLITKEQAATIVSESKAECSLTKGRLGRTIQKRMTLRQLSNVMGSDRDFFYEKDDEIAIQMFIKHCVEQEEITI